MLDTIKKAFEEARKHFVNPKVIACSITDYRDVKRICEENFPQIRVIWSSAVESGHIYLWDEEEGKC